MKVKSGLAGKRLMGVGRGQKKAMDDKYVQNTLYVYIKYLQMSQ